MIFNIDFDIIAEGIMKIGGALALVYFLFLLVRDLGKDD